MPTFGRRDNFRFMPENPFGSEEFAEWVAKRIAQLRENLGLTQEQLGDLVGVTKQAVSKWENGHPPGRVKLMEIGPALGAGTFALFPLQSVERFLMDERAATDGSGFRIGYEFPFEKEHLEFFQVLNQGANTFPSVIADLPKHRREVIERIASAAARHFRARVISWFADFYREIDN